MEGIWINEMEQNPKIAPQIKDKLIFSKCLLSIAMGEMNDGINSYLYGKNKPQFLKKKFVMDNVHKSKDLRKKTSGKNL